MNHDKLRVLLNDPYKEITTLKTIIDALTECAENLAVLEYENSMPALTKSKSKLRKARYILLEFEKIVGEKVSNEVHSDYAARERKTRGNPSKLIPGGKKQ